MTPQACTLSKVSNTKYLLNLSVLPGPRKTSVLSSLLPHTTTPMMGGVCRKNQWYNRDVFRCQGPTVAMSHEEKVAHYIDQFHAILLQSMIPTATKTQMKMLSKFDESSGAKQNDTKTRNLGHLLKPKLDRTTLQAIDSKSICSRRRLLPLVSNALLHCRPCIFNRIYRAKFVTTCWEPIRVFRYSFHVSHLRRARATKNAAAVHSLSQNCASARLRA